MSRRSDEVPEVLTALEELVTDSISKQGFSTEEANKIASKVVGEVAQMFGGECFYIPKGFMANIARRNEEIFKDDDRGVSVKALARKYSVSERRISQIIESRRS